MTTMSGQGAAGNAGPVARLQAELEHEEGLRVLALAELEQVKGELVMARGQLATAREQVAHSAESYDALMEAWGKLKMVTQRLQGELSNQERYNIASRRSLCEQSDRYKAERDQARAERDTARALVSETLVCW